MKVNIHHKPGHDVQTQHGKSASEASNVREKHILKIGGSAEEGDPPVKDTRIQVSSKAEGASKARKVAQEAPDVRAEKIAALKEKIESGNYQPDFEAVADRMVNDHMELGF